jgi:dCMP deaminase
VSQERNKQKHEVFLQIAVDLATLGTCDRKQVGAVIVSNGRCISWGFNGAPPGAPHCDENGHGWGVVERGDEEKVTLREMWPRWSEEAHLNESELARMPWDWKGGTDYLASIRGCRNATHAEANAIAAAARQGISTVGSALYVTVSPCESCARLIIAAGITSVHYLEEYRDRRGVDVLKGPMNLVLHWGPKDA